MVARTPKFLALITPLQRAVPHTVPLLLDLHGQSSVPVHLPQPGLLEAVASVEGVQFVELPARGGLQGCDQCQELRRLGHPGQDVQSKGLQEPETVKSLVIYLFFQVEY